MQHVTVKAAATVTSDLGEFTAIAAAYTVDRVKDRIVPGAFKATIGRWQTSGKRIPLHWNHEGDAKSIIGSIDPTTMAETDAGLYVEGHLDLEDSDTAREAWRSMKNGSMSLSFGYLVEKSRKAAQGVTDLLEIDLFEVSIVPVPANADTRVLSMKSAEAALILNQLQAIDERLARLESPENTVEATDAKASVDPLKKAALDLAMEVVTGGVPVQPPNNQATKVAAPQPEFDPDELRRHSRDLMVQVLSGTEET